MNNTIIELSEQVKSHMAKFCARTGITHFEHTRTFHNGKTIFICSTPAFMPHFFVQKYSRPAPDTYKKSCVLLWNAIPALLSYDQQIQDLKCNYNVDHGICFLEIHKKYIETRNFATTNDRVDLLNFYLNNRSMLNRVFCEYLEKFENAFLDIGKCMPAIPHRPKDFAVKKQASIDFAKTTQRERKCLELISLGYTAKRIAEFMYISPRTVERHIENVKEKLKVKYKGELINKFVQWQILSNETRV